MNKKRRMIRFSGLVLLLAVGFVLTLMPQKDADAATGSVSASSQFVYVPSGPGSTTISWSSNNCDTAQVYVSVDNGNEALMAQSASGSSNVGWITAGHSCVFKLYADTDHTELLDTVTVVGYGTNAGTIGVEEDELYIAPDGPTRGTASFTWGTNGYATSQIYVSVDGGADNLMSQGATGTCDAAWIAPGHTYYFRLYANTTHTTLLDSVTVYAYNDNRTIEWRWNIMMRDPFLLYENGVYYMYGTTPGQGVRGYYSTDPLLEGWYGPYTLFAGSEEWGDEYWAPEVHKVGSYYYLFVTMKPAASNYRGTYILRNTSPLGTYEPWTNGPITPPDANCLDGTLHFEGSTPWLVYVNEHTNFNPMVGRIHAVQLAADLKTRVSATDRELFRATD